MYVKLIDSSGATHCIECKRATWLGTDRELAEGYDGPESIVHYGTQSGRPDEFVAIVPIHGDRFIASDSWTAAYIMSDTGKTIDNLLAQNEPSAYRGEDTDVFSTHDPSKNERVVQ